MPHRAVHSVAFFITFLNYGEFIVLHEKWKFFGGSKSFYRRKWVPVLFVFIMHKCNKCNEEHHWSYDCDIVIHTSTQSLWLNFVLGYGFSIANVECIRIEWKLPFRGVNSRSIGILLILGEVILYKRQIKTFSWWHFCKRIPFWGFTRLRKD